MTMVHFGGPDCAPRALRNLLEERVRALPPGGAINWMTYYFRDERLAEELVRAQQRGVKVRVCLEGKPRHRGANDGVIAILARGIGAGLHVDHRLFGASHLHTKLYCFSGPDRHALVGSFNPSGNEPDDPKVLDDIGDQDRGHNLLVEVTDTLSLDFMVDRVAAIHAGRNPFARALMRQGQCRSAGQETFFYPRRRDHPLDERLDELGSGARLRIAASHFRDPAVSRRLARLARRGARVEVLTHHTLRRAPAAVMRSLTSKGVRAYRYEHPEGLPMHAKFVLAEDGDWRWSAFGSYNLTSTSRWLNQEILAFSEDVGLWDALDARWKSITSEPWCRS